MMLPPPLVRRLVLAPLVVVIAVGMVVLFPAAGRGGRGVRAGRAVRPARGGSASLRLLLFAVSWLAAETVALFVSLGLWIASGFGGRLRTEPYQDRNYAIMRRFLSRVYRAATRTYGLRVEVEEPDLTPDERLARLARPVMVLSRHAGPGDSVLLVHHLLSVYGRRPRVVLKATLQLDPLFDVIGNRVPNVFIRRHETGRHRYTRRSSGWPRGLGTDGALVIFPEGGNWTPRRWGRGVQRLERGGRATSRPGPNRCRTCCRRSRAACSPRSPRARTRT